MTCPASVLASVDHAAFGAATDLAPSSFASSSGLTYARRRFALAFADATGAPAAFSSTNTLDAWLVAVGGDAGTAAAGGGVSLASYVPEVAQVRGSGGALAPAFSLSSYNSAGLTLHGGWSEVAGNRLIAAGDVTGANLTMRVGQICNGGECTGASSFAGTLSAASIAYQVPSVGPRYLAGETLFRAYVYAAGGLPSDAAEVGASSPVAFHSVERITF